METKGDVTPTRKSLVGVPLPEEHVVYIAVKGSLHANDCSAFGLGQEEIKALTTKFPGSGSPVVNGVTIKINVLNAINALSQLGYKIISSTGEGEITWTLQREI